MPIYEHVTEFAGLPVVDFPSPDLEEQKLRRAQREARRRGEAAPDHVDPDPAYLAALPAPGTVAWRLRSFTVGMHEPFADYLARFVETVDTGKTTALLLGSWEDCYEESGAPLRDLLVAHADRFPALRALFFGEITMEEAEISWIQQCDVTPLLAAFPALEEFVVRGGDGLKFPAVRHEALRRLTVQTGGLPGKVTAGILACDLPALEHLELWLGVDYYGGTTDTDALAPLFAGEGFPNLRSLGLRNAEYTDDLVAALADAPVLRRLEVLDLSMGTLTDDGARVILDRPAAFRRLRRLDLHHHYLSDAMAADLPRALPGVELDLGDQQPKPRGDHRYPEVTE